MPLNVAWHRSTQGCDCACILCVLDCVGDNRHREVPVVRDILTMPQQALSPPAELIECVQDGFSGATQHTCKDDRRVRSFY